jgi:hypothetical protein
MRLYEMKNVDRIDHQLVKENPKAKNVTSQQVIDLSFLPKR